MAFRVSVSKVDASGVSLEVFEGDALVKQIQKPYSSLYALYGIVTKWYKKAFPKIANPNYGFFPPSIPDAQKALQNFFDVVVREVGGDNFIIKAFFRLYDLERKVVIITGASSGIGKQNAYQFAEMGAHVILGCRSEAKTLPILADIKAKSGNPNVEFIPIDLSSLASINAFVETFKSKNLPLHILINNAAMVVEGVTDYGVDLTFGTNHVGPFLLTMRLLDILKQTENSRIAFVASEAAFAAKGLPYDAIKQKIPLSIFNPMESYSYSKLANILCVKVLAKRLAEEQASSSSPSSNTSPSTSTSPTSPSSNTSPPSSCTRVYALHPGVVATDVWRALPSFIANVAKRFMLSEEEGSWCTLYCAIGEGCAEGSGNFYDYYQGASPASPQVPESEDEALQKVCWEESMKMSGL